MQLSKQNHSKYKVYEAHNKGGHCLPVPQCGHRHPQIPASLAPGLCEYSTRSGNFSPHQVTPRRRAEN